MTTVTNLDSDVDMRRPPTVLRNQILRQPRAALPKYTSFVYTQLPSLFFYLIAYLPCADIRNGVPRVNTTIAAGQAMHGKEHVP